MGVGAPGGLEIRHMGRGGRSGVGWACYHHGGSYQGVGAVPVGH